MEPRIDAHGAEPQDQPEDKLDAEVKQLRAVVSDLRTENDRLRRKVDEQTFHYVSDSVLRGQRRIAKRLSKFAMRWTVGVNLHNSLYRAVRAWRREGSVPDRELSDVIAAVTQWWARLNLFALLGGLVVIATLFAVLWQNILIQQQIGRQRQLTDSYRRAELLATIYDRRECDAESILDCPPRAHARARAEAAIAFVALERAYRPIEQPDLTGADLRTGDFTAADFAGLTLIETNFQNAFLANANLQDAYLSRVNFQDASLGAANLQETFLGDANLQNAFLGDANLRRADLRQADLRGANLEGADLRNSTLHGAIFNDATTWPAGFDALEAGAIFKE